jgi:L-iditol 2-dehydrogenase
MKSLKYYGPRDLQIEDAPVPKVTDGEVLIRVDVCGICATDVKTFLRGHPKIKPGTGLGHEVAGTIVEAPGSAKWTPGMKVTVAPYVACGACVQCRRGRFSLCPNLFADLLDPGGFSEFVRVPKRLAAEGLFALPSSLVPAASCFAEPVACCLHAMNSIHVSQGDSLAVIGDGVMGLLQAELGRLMGARPVILSGMTPERLERAKEIADVVIDAKNEDVPKAVLRETAGEGADKVLVSVADVRAAQTAMAIVRKGGAINLFAGMPAGSKLDVDMNRIHYDEVVLTGSFGFGPRDFQTAVEMISTGSLDTGRLITSFVPLDETKGAIEKLGRQEGLKTVVLCRDAAEG